MNQINLEIKNIANSGHGIANTKQYGSLYVLGAFPGDKIIANIYKTIGKISFAEIISFIEYSSLRDFSPKDKPFFDPNAPWKYLSEKAENKFKDKFVSELYNKHNTNLTSLSNSKFDNLPTINYRNKVAYSFMEQKGKLSFALYTRGTGGVEKIPQKENLLVHELLEKIGNQFLVFFNQKKLKLNKIKYLILRYSYLENNVVAHILVPEKNRKKLPFKKSDLESFIKNNVKIKGILVSHSDPKIRSSITTKDFFEIGDIDIVEKILDKKYTYHPSLFFQIYPKAFEEILKDLRKLLSNIQESKNLSILDLFAGIGIIGLEIADLVKDVTGVELSALSGEYARINAKNNKIINFTFKESNVDGVLNEIKEGQILIVDPPRSGLTSQITITILEKKPKYIFYISCNPETQFRDFQKMKEIYSLEFIKPYNLFPKTHHVESMIMLKRK